MEILYAIGISALVVLFVWSFIIKPLYESSEDFHVKANELKLNPNDKKDDSWALYKTKKTTFKNDCSKEQEIKALFCASYLALFKGIHAKFGTASIELLPYLYVIFDIAAIDSGYDRYKMKDIVFEFINEMLNNDEDGKDDKEELSQMMSWIESRIDLYGKVVRGYKPKGMMFVTDKSLVNNDNAICRCTVMLSDVLLDDDFSTVEEYEELPFIACDIFEAMENSALISEVAIASVKSHNMVYEIVKRR